MFKIRRLLCLTMAIVFSISVFSGCSGKKNPNDSSDEHIGFTSKSGDTDATNTQSADGTNTSADGTSGTTGKKTTTSAKFSGSSPDVKVQLSYDEGAVYMGDPLKGGKRITKLKNPVVRCLYWWPQDTDWEKKFRSLFNKEFGAKVEPIITTFDEFDNKLVSLIASGDSPDIAQMHGDKYPIAVIKGLYQPIDEWIDWNDPTYFRPMMEMFKWDGKYYGWSDRYSGGLFVLIYNKTLMKKAGIKTMPLDLDKEGKWTYDEFLKMARALTIKNTSTGKPTQWGYAGGFHAFMGTNDDEWIKLSSTGIPQQNLTDPKVTKVLELLQTLKKEGIAENDWSCNSFWQGKAGMTLAYVYEAYRLKANGVNDEWDFCGVPRGPQNKSGVQVGSLPSCAGIPIGAKNIEGAIALMNRRYRGYDELRNNDPNKLAKVQEERLIELTSKAKYWRTTYGEIGNDVWAIINGVTEDQRPIASVIAEHVPIWEKNINDTLASSTLVTKPAKPFNAPNTLTFENGNVTMFKTYDGKVEIVEGDQSPSGSKAAKITALKVGSIAMVALDSSFAKWEPGYNYSVTFDVKFTKAPKNQGKYFLQFSSGDGKETCGYYEFTGKLGQKTTITAEVALMYPLKDAELQFGAFNGSEISVDNIKIGVKTK